MTGSAEQPLQHRSDIDEQTARIQLAALFRLSAKEGFHEAVANHFSYAISADGKQFLMNPYGIHFSRIRASDLLVFSADEQPDFSDARIDITAWSIHGAMHRNNPDSRCLIHLHPHDATALLSLASPEVPPIDQNTARFYNRLSWDVGFDGMGIDEEGERLSHLLGDNHCLMMGQHGIMTAATTPSLAWDLAYYLERACRTYITALSTGRPLAIMAGQTAEKTARQWEAYDSQTNQQQIHFDAMLALLDEEDPSYRD